MQSYPYLQDLQRRLLIIYASYRWVLVMLMLVLAALEHRSGHSWLSWLALSWLLLIMLPSLGISSWLTWQRRSLQRSLPWLFTLDNVVLGLYISLGGPEALSFSLLLLVGVSIASLLLERRGSLMQTCLAVIALVYPGLFFNSQSTQSSLLLTLLLISSWGLIRYVRQRMLLSEQENARQAASITELTQLNDQILERMHTGVLVLDPSGDIKYSNSAAQLALSSQAEQQQQAKRQVRQRWQQWLSNPDSRPSPMPLHANGLSVQLRFAELHQPRGHALVFIEDSQRLLQAAQQLKLASLGRLTASIAHEIRNPLAAIDNAAQLLADAPHLDEQDRLLIAMMQRHSQRINGIITTILDLGRQPLSPPERLRLSHCLQPLLADYQAQHPHIRWQIALSDLEVPFASDALIQIVSNLIDNALAVLAGQPGGCIRVLASIANERQQSKLTVSNNGPMIDPDDCDRVFEPFFYKRPGGTGLGLYICRELCLSNFSDLRLVSSAAQTEFSIHFSHPKRQL